MTWEFRIAGPVATPWLWDEQGSPTIELLEPVRKPRSSEHNRHVPVTAYSITNATHIALESGLEHDLLRRVDRDPDAARIVAQPFRLSWTEPSAGSHTPDLLVGYADGRVVVWDARSTDDQDEDFKTKAAVSAPRRS